MARRTGQDGLASLDPSADSAPTEGESHSEHQAALDATLFRSGEDAYELVLELEAGELRLRRPGAR
ncbi:MAG TPA: hypothetical protein VKA74_06865 [Myxococcota bacterium]|nr:hypothetical protein [Myxococcota bacterium]